ncbi:MAG: hypothetical protein M3220_19605 [Chloroflexota bacterium]|nr:hypothetical protein [Chloroflexota bacterium]
MDWHPAVAYAEWGYEQECRLIWSTSLPAQASTPFVLWSTSRWKSMEKPCDIRGLTAVHDSL